MYLLIGRLLAPAAMFGDGLTRRPSHDSKTLLVIASTLHAAAAFAPVARPTFTRSSSSMNLLELPMGRPVLSARLLWRSAKPWRSTFTLVRQATSHLAAEEDVRGELLENVCDNILSDKGFDQAVASFSRSAIHALHPLHVDNLKSLLTSPHLLKAGDLSMEAETQGAWAQGYGQAATWLHFLPPNDASHAVASHAAAHALSAAVALPAVLGQAHAALPQFTTAAMLPFWAVLPLLAASRCPPLHLNASLHLDASAASSIVPFLRAPTPPPHAEGAVGGRGGHAEGAAPLSRRRMKRARRAAGDKH